MINLLLALYYIGRAEYIIKHANQYTEEQRFALDMTVIKVIKFTGGIRTKVYGAENLPNEGGYVMFSNHQGKYDALGILYGHKKPCSVVMDEKKSHMILVRQFLDLIDGKRLDKDNVKQAMKVIYEMAEEVREGKRFLIFPSGGYEKNENEVIPFKAGSFKSAVNAKAPIVPVAIVDSYKVFDKNKIGRVTTQVHFLKPLRYEDYKGMKTVEIAKLVETSIVDCVMANSET